AVRLLPPSSFPARRSSDLLGGAILGRTDQISDIRFFTRHTGPSISPFNAWVLSKSLETLSVRMDRHSQNALEFARHFEGDDELRSEEHTSELQSRENLVCR